MILYLLPPLCPIQNKIPFYAETSKLLGSKVLDLRVSTMYMIQKPQNGMTMTMTILPGDLSTN
jgi:hypothetical protein